MLSFVKYILVFSLLVTSQATSRAQSGKFDDEVNALSAENKDIDKKNVILFTGSSTIRMWKDIQTDFPGYNVINRGFGGSQTADLVFYTHKLILPYNPRQIFIYEGDNDLNAGKTTAQILASNDTIVQLIRTNGLKAQIFFISPKPSIARWNLKDKYEKYNQQLKVWAAKQKDVSFIDVFTPMLDAQGNVQKDLFLADGLHMNRKGYDIWTSVLKKYVR